MTKRKSKPSTTAASADAASGKAPDRKAVSKRTRPAGTKSGPRTKATDVTTAEPVPATTAEGSPASSVKQRAKSGKVSALDAAAQVLAEAGQALTCPEMIDAMAKKGYWTSPGGRTPAATLYSAILRELKTNGSDGRFVKTERGKFTRK